MPIALFPGQGVQQAGMGGALADEAPDVFAAASDVLGMDAVELCRTGVSGDADLSSTRWAQPAVLTCSVAAFRAVVSRGEAIRAVAGHSVGEYAALVASDAIAFSDALRLIALRAEVTAAAAIATPGAMTAFMKIDIDRVRSICSQTGASLAADNAVGQYVISGPVDAVEAAAALAAEARAVTRRLDVDGAFHSPVMAQAQKPLNAAVEDVTITAPTIEFWSSTTAAPLTDPDDIRRALIDQLVCGVRWRETVSGVAERHGGHLLDIGPGKVVGTLARRIVPGAEIRFVADMLAVGGAA